MLTSSFSRTCATYAIPETVPICEDLPQRPINPYGASKFIIERMLQSFDAAHWLRSISLSYFNAAGAASDGEIGEAHEPETHLIPLVLDVASGKRPSITVFGDDYDTPEGPCIQDYIHVSDQADAHVFAQKALDYSAKTTAYNLGNGVKFSVREVIASVERVMSKKVPLKIGPRRPGVPPPLVSDANFAMANLSWLPKYHEID